MTCCCMQRRDSRPPRQTRAPLETSKSAVNPYTVVDPYAAFVGDSGQTTKQVMSCARLLLPSTTSHGNQDLNSATEKHIAMRTSGSSVPFHTSTLCAPTVITQCQLEPHP
jgi:hypothetical protein